MSKLIAVCGSPACGKTSVSLKFAQELQTVTRTPVLYLSPDLRVPTIGYLFPNAKSRELHSLGIAMDKTDIYREDVLVQTVTTKSIPDLGLLGYALGENEYTYPAVTKDKVEGLFRAMAEVAAYIVVDCTCDRRDLISEAALAKADARIQLVSPDIKCMTYCESQSIPDRPKLIALNLMDNDIYLPIDEVKAHFKPVSVVLPYSHSLKQQGITGTLGERLSDSRFHAALSTLVRQVIG